MSGPKITVYNLTPEQAKRLRLQNTCHKKLLFQTQWLKDVQELLSKYVKESEELLRLVNTDHGFFEKKEALENLAEQELLQLKKGTAEDSIPFLEKVVEESKDREEQLKSQRKILDNIVRSNKNLLEEQVKQRNNSLDVASNLNFDFSRNGTSDLEEFHSLKENYILILDKYKGNIEFSSELQEKIKTAIKLLIEMKDLIFLKNAITIQLKPLIIECEEYQAYLNNQNVLQEEFNHINMEYELLCEILEQIPKKYLPTEENLLLLEKEVISLGEQLESVNQQNYIHETIQEVMEEMGYNLLGNRDVTKKNGAHFRNELFDYEDGTAVNITYANNGQIYVELGGLSEDDHLPDHDETSHLCRSMESFCGDFQILEKKLAEKGVILGKRLSHFPSEASYAQIINVTDYELKEKAKLLEIKKKKSSFQNKKSKYME